VYYIIKGYKKMLKLILEIIKKYKFELTEEEKIHYSIKQSIPNLSIYKKFMKEFVFECYNL
jgi:hypothetical protein